MISFNVAKLSFICDKAASDYGGRNLDYSAGAKEMIISYSRVGRLAELIQRETEKAVLIGAEYEKKPKTYYFSDSEDAEKARALFADVKAGQVVGEGIVRHYVIAIDNDSVTMAIYDPWQLWVPKSCLPEREEKELKTPGIVADPADPWRKWEISRRQNGNILMVCFTSDAYRVTAVEKEIPAEDLDKYILY